MCVWVSGSEGVATHLRHHLEIGDYVIKLPDLNSRGKVFPKSGRPQVDDRFPFTERFFLKAFVDQGISSDGLSLEEIESACEAYWLGDRVHRSDDGVFEPYQEFEGFVHDDDLSSDLKRDYEWEWSDGDARWSFSFVPSDDGVLGSVAPAGVRGNENPGVSIHKTSEGVVMIELIVAGVSNPGPNSTNVSILKDENGVARQTWIPNEIVQQYSIVPGSTIIVEQVRKIGVLETHWENADGEMVPLKNPRQRIQLGGEFRVESPDAEPLKPLSAS